MVTSGNDLISSIRTNGCGGYLCANGVLNAPNWNSSVYVLVFRCHPTSTVFSLLAFTPGNEITNVAFAELTTNATTIVWNTQSWGIPAFYKNYNDLSSLGSALGVVSHHSSWSQGTVVEFDSGYMLIRVSNWSSGHSGLFLSHANSVELIAGSTSFFSTTKDTENRINVYKISEFKIGVQKTTSGANTIDIVMI